MQPGRDGRERVGHSSTGTPGKGGREGSWEKREEDGGGEQREVREIRSGSSTLGLSTKILPPSVGVWGKQGDRVEELCRSGPATAETAQGQE